MVAAPLGTYCGWNLRARGFGYGAMHQFSGSYIPLPETPEERRTTDDPRRSILERCSDAQSYVAAIMAAARQLVEQGLMLKRMSSALPQRPPIGVARATMCVYDSAMTSPELR